MAVHFENKNLFLLFEINGHPVYLTQTLLSTWIVMAILAVIAVIVRVRSGKFKDTPAGFQNVIESAVEAIDKMLESNLGKGFEQYGGFFLALFAFILVSNYTALLGLRPPTADLATTAALALTTFLVIHILGVKRSKKKYFKEYVSPNPVFLPIHLIGEIAKPISLCFRLFGNILGGVIIFGLVYELFPPGAKFGIPGVFHAYFDFFVGALQAYVFTILSMAFIQQKAVIED
jgi:F-type H+-transporting ATPase subunit a